MTEADILRSLLADYGLPYLVALATGLVAALLTWLGW